MKRNEKNISLVLFLFCFCSIFINCESTTIGNVNTNNLEISISDFHIGRTSIKLNYIQRESIKIITDDNFTDYGFPGTGTKENPYRIENYNITPSKDVSAGIYIEYTTKHFVIQNCYLNTTGDGIYIDTVAENTTKILNNICIYNAWSGIFVTDISGALISNNTCMFNSFNGIDFIDSHYSNVTNNKCWNNTHDGLEVSFGSSNSWIFNNSLCYNNGNGMYLRGYDSIVENNTICYNDDGVANYEVFDHIFRYNYIAYNDDTGFRSSSASGAGNITNNQFYMNVGYGVYLTGGGVGYIQKNVFIDNNLGGTSQGYDSIGNSWDYNYYSDWSGSGPYSIDPGVTSDYNPSSSPDFPIISEYNYIAPIYVTIISALIVTALYLLKRSNKKKNGKGLV